MTTTKENLFRRTTLIALLLLPAAPVVAGIATADMLGQLRNGVPSMGAFEVAAPASTPGTPAGLSLTLQRVTLSG